MVRVFRASILRQFSGRAQVTERLSEVSCYLFHKNRAEEEGKGRRIKERESKRYFLSLLLKGSEACSLMVSL